MYRYEDIRVVHFEPTDRCNAACPQCPRSWNGGPVNPRLKLKDLDLHYIRTIFRPVFLEQLDQIYSCGNYGDPAFSKYILPAYKYFRNHNANLNLSIITNGGIQSEDWWREMAKILGKNGHVTFSIDGLGDTNHIYRRNVKWSNVVRNVKAFIEAGGRARWDFIVFRHNEHQIEEARSLSTELGFESIQFKKTGRFFKTKTGEFLEHTPVRNNAGDIVDSIYRPTLVEWQNEALQTDLQDVMQRYGTIQNYFDKVKIKCKVLEKQAIYINAEGFAFPCCWIAANATHNMDSPETRQLKELVDESIDATVHSLKDIVEGEVFNKIKESWDKSTDDGKLQTCARVCGVELDRYEKQFK